MVGESAVKKVSLDKSLRHRQASLVSATEQRLGEERDKEKAD
jgi:hypothetical protein